MNHFSALANGLTTNVWDGETKMLAERGIECERSGSPEKAVIDAALAKVSRQAGRDWLQRQRREARPSNGQDAAE